jgi:hypothetical protein
MVATVLTYTVPVLESAPPKGAVSAVVSTAPVRERSESWQIYSPLALPIRGPSLLS